jgi:hypothetical protein
MEPVSWFVPVVAMFCGIVTPPVTLCDLMVPENGR